MTKNTQAGRVLSKIRRKGNQGSRLPSSSQARLAELRASAKQIKTDCAHKAMKLIDHMDALCLDSCRAEKWINDG